MKRQFIAWLTVMVCAVLTASGFAGSPEAFTKQRQLIAQLEAKAQRLEKGAQTLTGAGRQELLLQRLKVKKLIEKIQRGEYVEPREIDALLGKGQK